MSIRAQLLVLLFITYAQYRRDQKKTTTDIMKYRYRQLEGLRGVGYLEGSQIIRAGHLDI